MNADELRLWRRFLARQMAKNWLATLEVKSKRIASEQAERNQRDNTEGAA